MNDLKFILVVDLISSEVKEFDSFYDFGQFLTFRFCGMPKYMRIIEDDSRADFVFELGFADEFSK